MAMSDLSAYIKVLRGPVLVTGAAGFVGANLFRMLVSQRDDVYAVVRHGNNSRLAEVADDKIIAVDVIDPAAVKNLVRNIEPQTVFDCVAYGGYPFENNAPLIYQTNFQAVVNLVEQLAGRPIAAYVHAGSSSEYGTNCAGVSEDGVCQPNTPYAVSKYAAASYLHYMGAQRNTPCINLRLFSVYGPLEDTSRLFPNLLRHALQGKLPPFVDARTSRDFIYVDDVCAAFILAAVRMHPGLFGHSFNIGTGVKTTIADLAALTRQVFDVKAEPQFGTMQGRVWDLPNWYANPQKAMAQLGWQPQVGLAEGMRTMSAWVAQLSDGDTISSSKQHPRKRKRSVSAVIACYKDAEAIPVMYRRLTDTFKSLGIDYEIIFVNDSSPDDCAQVIRDISRTDPRVLGVSHSRNFGSQMAFRSGMELFTKDGVVLLDGDLQDPPELIESFYAKWEEGYDVIFGRRIKREMSWYLSLMHKLFYRVFAMCSQVSMPLDAGDFSLVDRRVVGWLLNCPERDLFVRGLRAYVGFRQTGVDYVRPVRMFGRSTNNLFRNIAWAKRGILSFSDAPLTMLTVVGVVSLGFSTLAAIVVALLRLFVPDIAPRGATTLLIIILMFGSGNIFAISLVGEYVAKVMAEVKGRPRLIRTALIRNGELTELSSHGEVR